MLAPMRYGWVSLVAMLAGSCTFDSSGAPFDNGVEPKEDAAAPAADAALETDSVDAAPPDAPPPDATPLPACADHPDYVLHAGTGHWYRAVTDAVTWESAGQACAQHGAHLAVIDDAGENAHVRGLLDGNFWIGLSDLEVEGDFRWVTGAPLDYTNWASGEPNNWWGEDCVEVRGNGQWNDENCGRSRPFVCECDPDYFASTLGTD
jgi:hypothetical protein